MKLGEVYKANWEDSIMRVIGFDDYEVFYEVFWEHNDSWSFSSNTKRKYYFYRTTRGVFREKTEYVELKELEKNESDIFRPDIAIRTCRIRNASWSDEQLESKLTQQQLSEMPPINAPRIWLYPFGTKGGNKRGELITARNHEYFTPVELISEAKRIQNSVNTNQTNGIGIFRVGIQKEFPSYYIGEYHDLAGIMEVVEQNRMTED